MQFLVNYITDFLKDQADPGRIEMAKRSYPTKMKVIGVIVPKLKILLKEVKHKLDFGTKN